MARNNCGARRVISENAESILEQIAKGVSYRALERKYHIASPGYLARTLKDIGYELPQRDKRRQPTHRQYIESIAETLVAERKKGRLWKDIQVEYGIKSRDYLRETLSRLGYAYLFVKEGTETDAVPSYLAIDFSDKFLLKIGEKRRRAFWALMHDAAFVNGFTLQGEKNVFYLDLLLKVTGRKAFDEVTSAREFNALFMAAAIVARDAKMLERFRSNFVDHLKPRKYEEEPQDARREDYKGCLN